MTFFQQSVLNIFSMVDPECKLEYFSHIFLHNLIVLYHSICILIYYILQIIAISFRLYVKKLLYMIAHCKPHRFGKMKFVYSTIRKKLINCSFFLNIKSIKMKIFFKHFFYCQSMPTDNQQKNEIYEKHSRPNLSLRKIQTMYIVRKKY